MSSCLCLSLCYSVPHLPASESPARVKRAENTNTNRYVQLIKCIGRESPIHPTKVAAENIIFDRYNVLFFNEFAFAVQVKHK